MSESKLGVRRDRRSRLIFSLLLAIMCNYLVSKQKSLVWETNEGPRLVALISCLCSIVAGPVPM